MGAYLLVVTTLTVSHGLGWPAIHQVALTPRLFAEGKLWLLAASGFLADTNSTQALMLSVVGVAVLAIYLKSTRRFVHAAVFGHVGGTVLTELFYALSRPGTSADRLLNGPTNDVWLTLSSVPMRYT